MNKKIQSADHLLLVERDAHSQWYGKTFRLDFSDIRSERLRGQVKHYIWKNYRAGDKTPATLRQEVSQLKYYETWLWERKIDALEHIRREDAEGFLTFLHTCSSKRTGGTLRLVTQKHIYDTVRGIYRWYAAGNDAFAEAAELFPRDVYQRINRSIRTGRLSREKKERFLQAIEQADNPCLRYGGTILAATGISPSDLLGLETDCLTRDENGVRMRYYYHRGRTYRTVPVSPGCASAVEHLREQTEGLRRLAREETGRHLFLHYSKWEQVIVPDADLFRYWLRQLLACGEEKERMTLTQLRYARVKEMLMLEVPALVVSEVTGAAWAAYAGWDADVTGRPASPGTMPGQVQMPAEGRCGV